MGNRSNELKYLLNYNMTGYLGFLLLPVAFYILYISFKYGSTLQKTISSILVGLLTLFIFGWFSSGSALKNSEEFFVKRGDGKYQTYSESQKEDVLKILKMEKEVDKFILTFTSVGYWIILSIHIWLNIPNFKKAKQINAKKT